MKTLIIYNSLYDRSNKIANEAYDTFKSHKGWDPVLWDGCTPNDLSWYEDKYKVTEGKRTKPYGEKKLWESKKSCFYSHYSAWYFCANSDQPFAFVEHDTECISPLIEINLDWNKPVGVQLTTQSMIRHLPHYRKHQLKLDMTGPGLHKVWYDHPHGMTTFAGGTGYILSPSACRWLVEDCLKNGWTQNDLLFNDRDFELYYLYPSLVEYIPAKELKSSSGKLS